MTSIFLIRHAEAEGNAFRRLHGWYNSLVTRNGLRQIAALQARLMAETIDAVYASDLYRTMKTAEAAAKPRGLSVQADKRLREVYFGVWEDLPFGWLERFEQERMQGFGGTLAEWKVEKSETHAEYTGRFFAALEEIAQRHPKQSIAIASHGTVIRAAQQILLRSEDVPYCDNTAVSKLRYENGRWEIDYLNDCTHLPEEISTFARQKWWRRDANRGDYNLWFSPRTEGSYAALLGDEAVGTIRFDLKTGEIQQLCLLPQYCGMALGAQLLGQVVSELRKAGQGSMSIHLPEGHRAAHFFQEYGFIQTAPELWRANIEVP